MLNVPNEISMHAGHEKSMQKHKNQGLCQTFLHMPHGLGFLAKKHHMKSIVLIIICKHAHVEKNTHVVLYKCSYEIEPS